MNLRVFCGEYLDGLSAEAWGFPSAYAPECP